MEALAKLAEVVKLREKIAFYDMYYFSELVFATHQQKLERLEASLVNLSHLNSLSVLRRGFYCIANFTIQSRLN